MNPRMIAGGLVVANLALAGGVFWLWSQRPRAAEDPAEAEPSGPVPAAAESRTSAPAGSHKEARFTWRAVAARDLKLFVANLRRVKCPEETIQDIILAEVNRIYQAKEAALGLRKDGALLWEFAETSVDGDWQRRASLRQLRVEKRNLIYELLGIDVPGDIPSLVGSNFNSAWEQALAFLPIEKRGPVRAAQDRFWELSESLRKRSDGYLLPEDAEEYRRLRAERVAAMQKILTPEEFEQVEMRTSTTGNNLRTGLSAFEPSEAEFRAIFKAKRDLHEATYLPGQLVGVAYDPGAPSLTDLPNQAETQIKAALGDARYAEYQRAQDPNYQQISRVVQDAGLPKESVLLAYNAQQLAQTRIQQESQNPNLTPEQRREIVQQIRTESINTVKQAVGEAVFQQLQQRLPGRFRLPGTPRVNPPANRQFLVSPGDNLPPILRSDVPPTIPPP